MTAKLYLLTLSHPAQAARLMLEHKEIEHQIRKLLPGGHPAQLRLAGFRGGTVPALKLDGRRVQGSLSISRALDACRAGKPLFPDNPMGRAAIEEAEAWGEGELQPVPRRMFRWGASRRQSHRVWMIRDMGLPAPSLFAHVQKPLAHWFARMAEVSDERIRADIAALPEQLDHVDHLIAGGVIGGDEPNAADFQIGTTVRVLLAYDDIRPLVESRPAADLAMRLLPQYPGPVPPFLPPEWLSAVR